MRSRGLPEEGLRDAEPLAHPAREAGDGVVAVGPQVGLCEERLDLLAPRGPVCQPLEPGEVVEEGERRDAGVDAEVLGQVSEAPPVAHGVGEHVGALERDRARVRRLERRERPHERALAGAVGAEQAEEAGPEGQRHVVQRPHTAGVRL